MKLLQALAGNRHSAIRAVRAVTIGGVRNFAASSEEYAKRNYAGNESEYNTVITSLTSQRRYYLLREVYDDMMLDGVKPETDTFHSLLAGTMRGARLQDAFFFRDEMKAMGLLPNAETYNFLIATCGKSKNSDQATQLLEDMKTYEVKPTLQTYVCLLNTCAAAGRLDRVQAIVGDMTAAGLDLNRFCYAGLISAHRNKKPASDDLASKIIDLVQQSKGWQTTEQSNATAQNVMMNISEEELYNLPTAEYVRRRGGFIYRLFTVYHVALDAFADMKNVEAMETLLEMFKKDGNVPDVYMTMQIMRCYLHSGHIESGLRVFEEYMNSGKPPMIDLYVTLIEGAMTGYTPRGMQIAQDALNEMTSRNFSLNGKMGTDLLLVAAGEKDGGYTMANMIWDLLQVRRTAPLLAAVEAYYNGLKIREIPEDDPRLSDVSNTLNNLRARGGPRFGRP